MRHTVTSLLLSLTMLTFSGCAVITPAQDTTPVAENNASKQPEPVIRAFPEDAFFDLLVAEIALRNNDLDTALDNYTYQAEKTGDLGVIVTTTKLAQYLDRSDTAATYAQRWINLEPDATEGYFILASALAKTQQPLKALPYMIKVLELGGDSNFAALAATVLSRPDSEQQSFLNQLNVQLKSHPDDNSLKIAKALILQYQKQEEAALTLINDVLTEEPDNPHALLIETRTLNQMGRHDQALTQLRYAVDQNPHHKRLRHDLARALVKVDLFHAKAQYEELVRQNPNDRELLLELMLINRELSNTEEVASQLKSLSDTPELRSRANYILGRLDEEDQNWPQAINHYLQATGSDEFHQSSQRIAGISLAVENPEKALSRLQALRLNHPEHATFVFLLEAEILRKEMRYQQGYELLSKALTNNTNDEELRYARSLFSEKLGNIDAVEHDLQYLITRDPNNATALNALGYSLANLNHSRLDEAEQLVKRALELEPNDPAIIDSYGWIMLLKGNIDEAITLLELAFEQTQDHEIAAHLGEALWLSGDKTRAKTIWQEGLKDTPNSPIIMDTLRKLELFDE
ncbi:Beta-barrel assembly-enhancing protease [Zhongshania aliphaticivorans]|uniref:Beta-barrel assembly-enhancing protease n=1 Tax=Zhongshania aliphaticivorans TaxID=1470434 RepID=A0A5S9N177_9GAMM|nr:tetratricopeptide repeat protein [Zhongshania aliphaticivorans]CAA0083173.1 Beta-barrel assembly-enhancing protease [Zhongshania aliphaticivorans]CAA0083613.1 Beta-barrel assembly-enhancing protease [Zhongshania aliphaticivorans]